MKLLPAFFLSCLITVSSAAPAGPPGPYAPAAPYPRPDPYQDPYYDDTPYVPCPGYPYCSDAPANLYHLQEEIDSLRTRNAQIVAIGERLVNQLPNRPFVGGYQYL